MGKLTISAFLMGLSTTALAQQASTVSNMPYASTPFNGSEFIYMIQNGTSTKTNFSTFSSQITNPVLNPGITPILNGINGCVFYDNSALLGCSTTLPTGLAIPNATFTSPALGTVTSGVWQATPIANAYLAHNSLTVNGVNIPLGGSGTITATATQITPGSTLVGSTHTGYIEYNNNGVLGELSTSGSGTTVALAGSPTLSGTVTLPDASTWTSSGLSALTSLGNVVAGATVNSGAANLVLSENLAASTGSKAQFEALTGTTNAYTVLQNVDGPTGSVAPYGQIVTGAGDTAGLKIGTLSGPITFTPNVISGTVTSILGLTSGNALATAVLSGNTTKLVTTTGPLTSGYCAQFDSNGNIVQASGACSSGGGGSGTVSSGTIYDLAYYAATGTTVSALITANNGVLVTNGSGVPTISSTLPSAVQANITGLGTIASGVWNGTAIANAYLANSTISGVYLGSNLFSLTFGTHLAAGASTYNGSTAATLTSDATNTNTASTIVARDASGNFSAGTITASLTGHSSLDLALAGGTLTGTLTGADGGTWGSSGIAATTLTTTGNETIGYSTPNSGAARTLFITNLATANGTQSQIELQTGSSGASTDFLKIAQSDGSSLQASLTSGAGDTNGLLISTTAGPINLTTASTIVIANGVSSGTATELLGLNSSYQIVNATTIPTGVTAPGLIVTGSLTATGLVTVADLTNPSTTVNGQTCTLGGSCTITSSAGSIVAGTTTVTGGPGVLYNTSSGGTLVSSATLPSGLSAPSFTVTSAFTATGLVTVADLTNPSTTVNGQTCTLGSSCTITASAGSIAAGTTTVTGGPGVLYNTSSGGTLVSSATLPSGLSAPSFTVTSAFTATGLVTNADLANSTISGVLLGSNLFSLTFGTHLASGGSTYNGSAATTITSDATNANTASTIVARDGSGNFSAGTITASLTGHASLDLPLTGGTLSGTLTAADGGTWSSSGINGSIIGATTAAAGNFTTIGTTAVGVSLSVGSTARAGLTNEALLENLSTTAGTKAIFLEQTGTTNATFAFEQLDVQSSGTTLAGLIASGTGDTGGIQIKSGAGPITLSPTTTIVMPTVTSGSPAFVLALDSSANVINQAISGVTGTGNLVLSNSPTFTGTPTISGYQTSATLPEGVSLFTAGCVADGVTDQSSCINTAMSTYTGCLVVPPTALGFYVSSSIVVTSCLKGSAFEPSNPYNSTYPTSPFAGTSWIKCANAAFACVKMATYNSLQYSPIIDSIIIAGSNGTGVATSGSIGLQFVGGYNDQTRNIYVYNFDTCVQAGPVGISISAFNYNMYAALCQTHYYVIDSWPEFTVIGGRAGANGSDPYITTNDFVYQTLSATVGAGGGPNTVKFIDYNFFSSGLACAFRWGGFTGSGGVQTETRFDNDHVEWHQYGSGGTATQGIFCSDSTVPSISNLFVSHMVTETGGSNAALWNLNSATIPSQWFFDDSNFSCTSATLNMGAPSSIANSDVHMNNNFMCGTVTYNGGTNSVAYLNGNLEGSLVTSGNWVNLQIIGETYGSLTNGATGNVSLNSPGAITVPTAYEVNSGNNIFLNIGSGYSVQVEAPGTGSTSTMLELEASLGTGNVVAEQIGVSLSNQNTGITEFHYAGGSGSSSNYMALHLYGQQGIDIYGTGLVTMPSLTTSGAITGGSGGNNGGSEAITVENLTTATTTTAQIFATTGSSNAYIVMENSDGATLRGDILTGSGDTNGLHIATTSGPIALYPNAGFTISGLSNVATTSALCYNTGTGAVTYDGTIGTCNTSSERFKHDIAPIAFDALAGVTAMRPVSFDYNVDMHTPEHQLGFIAEDLNRIDPLLVGRDDEGKPNSIRFLGPMFAYVVGAEQQMQNEIVQLRARVAQLERTTH